MAGSTSKRVMTGPADAPATVTGTLNSARRWAIRWLVSSRCSAGTATVSGDAAVSSATLGSR